MQELLNSDETVLFQISKLNVIYIKGNLSWHKQLHSFFYGASSRFKVMACRLLPGFGNEFFLIISSSWLLCGVRWFETDVSGLPIGPIFKGQAVKEAWPSKTRPIDSPETSVSNNLTPRNNQQNGITQFIHGGSLRSPN
jgi:hypothetical protein